MFNRIKASSLVVGLMSLVLYSAYVVAQSGDFGGGGTNPTVSGGSGNAQTNAAVQAWSGTNTFNGPTTFNGSTYHLGASNQFLKPVIFGTNNTVAISGDIATFDGRNNVYNQIGFLGNGNDLYFSIGDYINGDDYTTISQNGANFLMDHGTAVTLARWNMIAGGSIDLEVGGSDRIRAVTAGARIGPNGAAITNIVSATIVADPPDLASLASFTTNFACTGARAGNSPVDVGSDGITNAIWYRGFCLTNGTLWVEFRNLSGSNVDGPSQTIRAVQTVIEP